MRIPLPVPGLPVLLTALLAASASGQPEIHPDELALKPQIDDAIGRGIEALLREQQRDGSWGVHGGYYGGRTGLCVYTLLKSGVQPDHPAILRGLAYLDAIEPTKTYAAACMMLAYGATDRKEHEDRVAALLDRLLSWQKGTGDWGYPTSRPDLSNTQYAALGMWSASKLGLKVPPAAWKALVDGVFRYREEPRMIDVPITTRTGTGKLLVAGFGYTPGRKPSGSMTAAGASILQICKIGLGKRLRRKDRERIDAAIEAGTAWLGRHFSVTTNPGHRGHLYYYLYGLERLGSLTRIEQIGKHWWYLQGARFLTRKQHRNGVWSRSGRMGHTDTCFALLFLRRATSIGPMTGGSGFTPRHLFAAGSAADDVALRGAGQQPLALWVEGFGQRLQQRHSTYGLRVLQVEYLEGDRKLGEAAGDPTKAWKTDTYMYRCSALRRGEHSIRARVTLVAPDVPPGESSPTETVTSPAMKVGIRDVFAPWMVLAAQMQKDNLMRGVKVAASATSNSDQAKLVVDGKDTTHWVCDPKDDAATLTLEFEEPIIARRLVLTQPPVHDSQVNRFDHIIEVEVKFNKDAKAARIELNDDPLAPTAYDLPRARKIRKVTIQILLRLPGRTPGLAGFSEVAITDKKPKRR